MKKLVFGLIATVMISSVSFAQNRMTISSSVTTEEYKSLDLNDQRLSDYLSGAIASLNAMELNGIKNKTMRLLFILMKTAKTL